MADAGPVEESLETLFTDDAAVEVVVVAGVPGTAMELSIPHVLPTESYTAKSVAADSGDPCLVDRLCWEAFRVPFPCNRVRAISLHTESGHTGGTIGEMCEKPRIDIGGRDDVVFKEKDPWGRAEVGKVLVDLCTGSSHFPRDDSSRKVSETFKANREWNVRVFSIIGVEKPRLHSVAEG